MKLFPSLLVAGLILASSGAQLVASPILQYEFNQAGAIQSSSGSESLDLTLYNYNKAATDYITTAPVLRSGAGNALALNFTGSNVDNGLSASQKFKGSADATLTNENASFLRSDLESFTISAWVFDVKPNDTSNVTRRLFSLRDNSSGRQVIDFRLYYRAATNTNEIHFGLGGTEGDRMFQVNPLEAAVPADDSRWVFVSVTYDATTGELNFYSGLDGGVLGHATASNTTGEEVNTLLKTGNRLAIGNVGYEHQRRMEGYLSDVRFYDYALEANEIQNLYAIPEPSAVIFMGAGTLLLCVRRMRKKGALTV